jgi:hypothetical protein
MDGGKCRKETYAGYFAEFGSSLGPLPVTIGVDIGLNNAAISPVHGLPLPGAPNGVSEGSVGIGTRGGKAALCYYIPF